MTEYNLYCDESCHLEHDDSDVMVLGALIIPKDKKQEITENIPPDQGTLRRQGTHGSEVDEGQHAENRPVQGPTELLLPG